MNYSKAFLLCFIYFASFSLSAHHKALPTSCVFTEDRTEKTIKNTMDVYGDLVINASKAHGYEWREVLAIVVAESCGDTLAVSRKGAQGLMQLMPYTANNMGIEDSFNPYDNLWAGIKYLKYLEEEKGFVVREEKILAYNEGPQGARRYLSRGKLARKHNYVASVIHTLAIVHQIYPA